MLNRYRQWQHQLEQQKPQLDHALIGRGVQLVQQCAERQQQFDPDVSLAVASELNLLDCDSDVITAGLIYPLCAGYPLMDGTLAETLNESVAQLFQGAKRVESIDTIASTSIQVTTAEQISNLRKMLLAVIDDVRVVLLRLTERLVCLRYASQLTSVQRHDTAKQVMYLYAPLANRLGIGQLKWQLEDLAFRYLDPKHYFAISKAINMRRAHREKMLQAMRSTLHDILSTASLENFEISGRVKHIYGLHQKAQRKQLDLENIFDAIALRVLVAEVKTCYEVLSHIHARWQPISTEFDDYIAHPKTNGYQSLHTVVTDEAGMVVEIQIRTYQMHREAELGIAAHWKYKENNKAHSEYEQKINVLRDFMHWQQELGDENNHIKNIFNKLFNDRIYVFTPEDEIIDLPRGATPLDFAYKVHTQVGHRCRGAKVNGKIAPLVQQLATRDRVEIITQKQAAPSRDWINPHAGYLVTQQALQKVKAWFRYQEQHEYRQKGQMLWEKACRRYQVPVGALKQIYADFKLASIEELLLQMGNGKIGVNSVIQRLQHTGELAGSEAASVVASLPHKNQTQSVDTLKVNDNVLTRLASCCCPVPGDAIVGYITKGRGIVVHQTHCSNLGYFRGRHPERLWVLDWSDINKKYYPAKLRIITHDYVNLVHDISGLLAQQHIDLLGIASHPDKLTRCWTVQVTIAISHTDALQKVMANLKQLSSIVTVERSQV